MKNCPFCNAELEDDVTFCTNCGKELEEKAEEVVEEVKEEVVEEAAEEVKAAPQAAPVAAAGTLPTNKSLLKLILLGIITLGIYDLVIMTKIGCELNRTATPYDGKKTMNFCLVAFIFSWLTCGIVPIVWFHRISNRLHDEMVRRGIGYADKLSAASYWLWCVLGSCIVVGPFVYMHKLCKATNLINADYNAKGC